MTDVHMTDDAIRRVSGRDLEWCSREADEAHKAKARDFALAPSSRAGCFFCASRRVGTVSGFSTWLQAIIVQRPLL